MVGPTLLKESSWVLVQGVKAEDGDEGEDDGEGDVKRDYMTTSADCSNTVGIGEERERRRGGAL